MIISAENLDTKTEYLNTDTVSFYTFNLSFNSSCHTEWDSDIYLLYYYKTGINDSYPLTSYVLCEY